MSKTSQAHIRTNKTPAPPMPNRLVRLLSEARWLALAACWPIWR
jgi:S-DNA-T family DNA segregation ATPase FtsK/SpoIIIE